MTVFQSLLFYVFSFLLSSLLVYLGSRPKYEDFSLRIFLNKRINILTTVGLIIPILIGGLLSGVGIDYDGYMRLFEKSNELDYAGFLAYNGFWTVEPSFYLLARASMSIVDGSWLLFTVYSSINIIFFYLFLKRIIPSQRALGFYIYLFIFFLFTMTLMRQGAAIAVCLYALTYLLEKRYFTYSALIGLASLIHFSALFFLITLPLFLLIKPAKPNWIALASIVALGLFVVASPSLIQLITSIPPFDKYVYLLSKGRDDVLVGWTFLLQLVILSVITLLYYKLAHMYKYASLLYSMLVLGLIAYSLNFRIDYASRLSYFFLPVTTVLLPYLSNVFRNNRLILFIMMLSCVLYFVKIYYTGNTMMVFPYNFVWSK